MFTGARFTALGCLMEMGLWQSGGGLIGSSHLEDRERFAHVHFRHSIPEYRPSVQTGVVLIWCSRIAFR